MTSKLDNQIRDALRAEDAELFDEYSEEQPIHEMLIGVFRGRNRMLVVGVFIMSIVMLAFSIFCTVRFFQAAEIEQQFGWAIGIFFGLTTVMGMKVWVWLEMNKNTLTREVKRVELQIARLAQRIEDLAEDRSSP